MTKLSLANLGAIARSIAVPAYDRSGLRPGIVHFGVGNFHRAHLAVYLDDLFNLGVDHDWAIIGAGVMPADEKMRTALRSQDWLSTIVEQDNELSAAHVTGCMVDFIPPSDRPALIARLADPSTRIVSLTVTEGGYMIDPATQKFDPGHPALVRDAAHPADPTSVFGLILRGLALRRERGIAPYTVMSCDNVPHNGVVTRNAIAGLARLSDAKLAAWVEQNVAFPNAMVDRITPATSDRERQITREIFGVEDAWPVFCEEFKQWVIEDKFALGRPAFEKVGAQFVPDVTPYENMKIRILNGGHATIAYPAGLLGIHFVHEAMQHPLVRGLFARVETEEIIPTVAPVPNTSLSDYYKLIDRRFSNPKIGDTVRRLCFDGPNRQPKFIVPPLADQLKAGRSIAGLALVSALWCRYCHGTTDGGQPIEPNDPDWERLTAFARRAKDDPPAWLGMKDVYGATAEHPLFRQAFTAALNDLWRKGTAATLTAYIGH